MSARTVLISAWMSGTRTRTGPDNPPRIWNKWDSYERTLQEFKWRNSHMHSLMGRYRDGNHRQPRYRAKRLCHTDCSVVGHFFSKIFIWRRTVWRRFLKTRVAVLSETTPRANDFVETNEVKVHYLSRILFVCEELSVIEHEASALMTDEKERFADLNSIYRLKQKLEVIAEGSNHVRFVSQMDGEGIHWKNENVF